MDVSDAKRLRQLGDENAKLKKLLADSCLFSSLQLMAPDAGPCSTQVVMGLRR
jgi:hypothetical protein